MLMIADHNNCSPGTFERNLSCPTSIISDRTTNNIPTSKRSSSISTDPLPIIHDLQANPIEIDRTFDNQLSTNKSWIDRCKQSLKSLFKQISRPTTKQDSMMMINTVYQQESIFNYDPELDLREEHISLVSKRLLSTLRESKIKHLSCDNLFLPCNHIRNIARQCLIMSAEEPFGIMGAQIKIKLTLLSSNMTSTITKYLPVIQINPKQKSTFEIEIDLHEDTKVFTLKNILPSFKMFKQLKERGPLYVSPRCLLVKNVFYKTAEPKRAFVNSS